MWHPCPVQAEPRKLGSEDDTEEVGLGGAGPHDNDHVAKEASTIFEKQNKNKKNKKNREREVEIGEAYKGKRRDQTGGFYRIYICG